MEYYFEDLFLLDFNSVKFVRDRSAYICFDIKLAKPVILKIDEY